jgi:hypothetical protein
VGASIVIDQAHVEVAGNTHALMIPGVGLAVKTTTASKGWPL